MEKTYKRVPFDIELAKKIQSGDVEGKIVTANGTPVKIICFDFVGRFDKLIIALIKDGLYEKIYTYDDKGTWDYEVSTTYDLHIELPEEAPITFHVDVPKGHAEIHGDTISFVNEEIPKLDDITTREGFCRTFQKHEFKPFDKVLVRHSDNSIWRPRLYSRKGNVGYCVQDGLEYMQILPYEGHEHLVGTTNNLE